MMDCENCEKTIKEETILEQLKREALYAQRSFSTKLLYQTYGKALMARQLGVLSQSEFMEINHMTVHYMNTDKKYIRHCNRKPFHDGSIDWDYLTGGHFENMERRR